MQFNIHLYDLLRFFFWFLFSIYWSHDLNFKVFLPLTSNIVRFIKLLLVEVDINSKTNLQVINILKTNNISSVHLHQNLRELCE